MFISFLIYIKYTLFNILYMYIYMYFGHIQQCSGASGVGDQTWAFCLPNEQYWTLFLSLNIFLNFFLGGSVWECRRGLLHTQPCSRTSPPAFCSEVGRSSALETLKCWGSNLYLLQAKKMPYLVALSLWPKKFLSEKESLDSRSHCAQSYISSALNSTLSVEVNVFVVKQNITAGMISVRSSVLGIESRSAMWKGSTLNLYTISGC